MEHLLKVSQQTIWQIIGKIISSASTFITLGIISRTYHESGTGIFTLSLTYLAIFNLLSDFGFNAHVLKGITGNRQQVTVKWKKLLGGRIFWSSILVILSASTLLILPFATQEFSRAVLFGSLAIYGSAIFTTCNLIFQSKHRYDLSVASSSIGTLTGLIFYVGLSSQSLPIPFLLTAYSLSWLIIAVSSLFLVKRFLNPFLPIFDMRYTINLFKQSWPIAATLALNVVYFRADAFILSFYHGVAEAGVYNIAYSLFQTVLVLPTFIMNAYYPLMLKSLSKVKSVGIGLLGLAVLGTVITYNLAPAVISLITGKGFVGSSQSLQILSLSFPAFFLSSLLMWWLITKGKYKNMLLIYSAGLLINLALNLYYIPQYSYMAASWITVICEYLILILLAVSVGW